MGGSYSGQVCTTYNRVTGVRITYLLPDRLLGFSCFRIKLRDHKNSHTKLTDPQLMKENKVTYPHESRIVGHTKQSNMAEDEERGRANGLLARTCRPCLIMENDSA